MFPGEVTTKAHEVLKKMRQGSVKLTTAESCTGGLVSALLTDIPGASDVVERGFVTYSNDAKIELLTVPTFYIEQFGAVSMEVATAMAEGALLFSKANISVAITGIAGPEGGTDEKPIGMVFIATAYQGHKTEYERFIFSGNRHSIRMQATFEALNQVSKRLER